MNKKEVKELKDIGFDKDELKKIYSKVKNLEIDFSIGNYRFILDAMIDGIERDELSNDTYVLGCFSDWFIADILDVDLDVIQALQKAEAFDAIGKMMLKHIDEVQSKYASIDGYGHHFSSYDDNENEVTLNGSFYHVFRTN